MTKTYLNIAFLMVLAVVGTLNAGAQITIKLPNVKKLIKPDVITTTETKGRTNAVTAENTTAKAADSNPTNWWVDYQIGEISKYRSEIESWDPVNQVFPRPTSSDDYISLAFSKKERASWLRDKKVQPNAKLDTALDELKGALSRRMPEYTINTSSFTIRNAAEEKLLLAELAEISGLKVFKTGFNQPAWIIDKNEWGIPKARYKHGLVYGRDPAREDPFCRVWYINVVQEYSGAGTYGPTSARYIQKEFIACPPGQ